jgi:hypothetical protein
VGIVKRKFFSPTFFKEKIFLNNKGTKGPKGTKE